MLLPAPTTPASWKELLAEYWAPQKNSFPHLVVRSSGQSLLPDPTALSFSLKASSHQSLRTAEGTYLKDFVVLSALLAGWAPGDSFRRLKIASLFFMSLALRAEAEKRVDQLGPHDPCKLGCRRLQTGAKGHLLLHGVPPL